MIFVTVGTQKFQFNRLIKEVDDYVGNSNEVAFRQIGNSTYKPKNFGYKNFLSANDFDKYISDCDLVITHSGVATIVKALKLNKPVIVVPRLKKYGEHVDDHQEQIAEIFSQKNYVLWGKDGDKIEDLIMKIKKMKFDKYVSNRYEMIQTIETFLHTVDK